MGKVIAVTSGKGGTGKSTFCVGLSRSLAAKGNRLLLIDTDEGLRCLDLLLGIDRELVFDLSDIIGGRPIGDAIYTVPGNEGINLIPAPAEPGSLTPDSFEALLGNVIPEYDYIIIDFPAGLDFSLYRVLPRQALIIAVCCPDAVSVRDAASVCSHIPSFEKEPVLILNRFKAEDVKNGIVGCIDDTIDRSGFRLLGIVPESRELALLASIHSFSKKGRARRAFDRIAARLSGERCCLPPPKKI